MARVRAAVLAAGRGIRMGGRVPKAVLPLDDREPLLHHLLAGLKEAGIDDLLVVTGYLPDQVASFVTERWGEDNLQFVRNTRYASWGNFHSVRMAIDQSPGTDLLVVNSDIVIAPDIYSRVASAEGDLVLAVERRLVLDQEDMRVQLDGDRVRRVSKQLKRSLGHGEYCGVSLLRPEAQLAYSDLASTVEWTGDTALYYEDIYDRILDRVDARAVDVPPGRYAEVDVPEDVAYALKVVDEIHATARESSVAG